MTETTTFEYVRQIDVDAITALGPEDRFSQKLLDHTNGAIGAQITYIVTPPGGGSPRGLHTHDYEQLFFLISGVMEIEIEGQPQLTVQPGGLIIFPKGHPHRNWNASQESTVHIAINTPAPGPKEK
jgi:quercetin dioxygenase-like cupin family protein